MERESMEFDVVVVGGGPSGLAAAIKLSQLAQENEKELTVCVVEKGSEIGAHILSGAVIETRPLSSLFPDWKEKGAPLQWKQREQFLHLTETGWQKMPIHTMNNHATTCSRASVPWWRPARTAVKSPGLRCKSYTQTVAKDAPEMPQK